jgi:hypothetical protein
MRRIRGRHAAVALGALVAVAMGTTTFVVAQTSDDGSGGPPEAPPGTPYLDPALQPDGLTEGVGEQIAVGGALDPTVLTKFIPGDAFVANQGVNGSLVEDALEYGNGVCVSPNPAAGDNDAIVRAPIELPDGAQIKQILLFGRDDAATNMTVSLNRTNLRQSLLGGPLTRTDLTVDSFTTVGQSGVFALAGTDNLAEQTGNFAAGSFPLILGTDHRFHAIEVFMLTAAGTNHAVCGVQVQYQVPAASTPTGTVFTPVDPFRAYDSRQAAYAPNNVVLGPNQSRVISIKDARDTAGNIVTADVIPTNATAITYNITIAGPTAPNFVAVTPGDAASFTASAINFNGTADIANAGTVKIAADRTIKVWGGDQAGSMHILIDVTGYYTPVQNPSFPNMGN